MNALLPASTFTHFKITSVTPTIGALAYTALLLILSHFEKGG